MAISDKTLLGAALTAFGVSLLLAGPAGPAGLAFGAALLVSVAIAATFASLLHFGPSMRVGIWPSFGFGGFFHRPWFGPSHSRGFVPGGVHTPASTFGHRPAHTTAFHAAPSITPSFRPSHGGGFFGGFGGGATRVGSVFVPGGVRGR